LPYHLYAAQKTKPFDEIPILADPSEAQTTKQPNKETNALNHRHDPLTFHLGDFIVYPGRNLITHEKSEVVIEPQVMNVLQALSGYRGNVATRKELLDKAWAFSGGTDESLTRSVSILRKAFAALNESSGIIQTIHKRGYRLTVPVSFPSLSQQANRYTVISIAVFPFKNLNRNNKESYLARGISEEVLNMLSKIPTLHVVGRSSSFAMAEQNIDHNAIASSLNVSHILEGSVRVDDERLRVSASLTDVETSFQVWSHSFDIALVHIFDIQDKIAQSITQALQTKFLVSPAPHMTQKLTRDPKAYDLFLQGRAVNQRIYTEGAIERAQSLLTQAIGRDANFAQAHVELARTYLRKATYVKPRDKKNCILEASKIAETALKIDPEYAAAQTIVAHKKYIFGDIVGALSCAESAYNAQPNNSEIASELGSYLLAIGRVRAAIPYLEEAVSLDPIQGRSLQVLAIAKLSNGDFTDADVLAKRALDLGYAYAVDTYAAVAYAMGKPDLAMQRMTSLPQNVLNNFGSTFSKRAVWQDGIQGFYGDDDRASSASVRRSLAMLDHIDVLEENSPAELLLAMSLLRLGAADELFKVIGDAPPSGSHAVLLNLWGVGRPYSKIYNHPNFSTFADRIGFTKAWRQYGWPDRLQ
jgi:TolB-like protein